jgi:hypothetical protein
LTLTACAPPNHKEVYKNAHGRVLRAVCELIINSSAVATYVLKLPGAKAIILTSCLVHKGSAEFFLSIKNCERVLDTTAKKLRQIEATFKHRETYYKNHPNEAQLLQQQQSLILQNNRNIWAIMKQLFLSGALKNIRPLHELQEESISTKQSDIQKSKTTRSQLPTIESSLTSTNGSKCELRRIHSFDSSFNSKLSSHEYLFTNPNSITSNNGELIKSNSRPKSGEALTRNNKMFPNNKQLIRNNPCKIIIYNNKCLYLNCVVVVPQGSSARPSTSGGEMHSLHRDLFQNMPWRPQLPQRIDPNDIIESGVQGLSKGIHNVEEAMRRSVTLESSLYATATQSGKYIINNTT